MTAPHYTVSTPAGAAGFHAQFAARVAHWPFARLTEHVWVDRDDEFKVQLQLLDRQLRFITALHPGEAMLAPGRQWTVDLRYLHRPGSPRVDCILVGKAFDAHTAAEAEASAGELWELASTAMPVGYDLTPAATEADQRAWSGADIAARAADRRQWAEIRRPAEFLLWTDETQPALYLPLVYPFRWEPSGWDVVWAALARLTEPALISVSLRPAHLPPADERVLSDLVYDLHTVAGTTRPPLNQRAAEAAGWYENYARGLRVAYTVRVSVLGAPALRWPLRSALSGPGWNLDGGPPGGHTLPAEVVSPGDAEWDIVQRNFDFLEQEVWGPKPWGNAHLLPALERLRFLVDPAGALCAFRLPLLPPGGFPGVEIGHEINLGS